ASTKSFDDYSVGILGLEGKEGTYKDAEDGELSKNAIEHGQVDSVISLSCELAPSESEILYYWITAAKSIREVHDLNAYVLEKTPQYLMETAQDFWYAWVNKQNFSFYGLDLPIIELFKKSLFVLRAHVDSNGSILASGDSSMLEHGRDTYGYMWPRDGAFIATALDKAGDLNVAKRFFEFCNQVINDEGYLMHKYRPDKSLGSSWHPWVRDGEPALPIQEDETALVIYTLWKHYELSKDLEFVEEIYNSLIKKAANFMISYVDKKTGLPLPSYDLWEEKFGVSTFTSSSVYAALIAASKFASVLGKTESEQRYKKAADKMREAILRYLYNEKEGNFYKMIRFSGDEVIYDKTIDISSVYGVFKFRVLDIEDERLKIAIGNTQKSLECKTDVGGIARYQGDQYYRVPGDVPGNPWFITTLWLVQYHIFKAKSEKDLQIAKEWFKWVVKYALPSGILSEQINPYTGEQVSAAPLTWSHAEFVVSVIAYMEKLEQLGIAKVSHPFEF
ncbi:MAG: glycoside hydrolase family 15 protein, partial [Candidatus Levybacteria bacterium]|nr:glycoside hydrolase family 15 protein [Candidatus Levybacteria bacterium]